MPNVVVDASTISTAVVMDGEHSVYCPGAARSHPASQRHDAVRHALVTGGAGFIGSHLTRALLAHGRQVTVLDNLSVGRREVVPEGARFVHGDIRDERAVADALHGVDCVFHLAAQVTIRGSFDRFYEDLDTNVMGTARLLQAVDPGARQVVRAGLVHGRLCRRRRADADRREPPHAAAVAVRHRQARGGRRVAADSGRARHSVHGGALSSTPSDPGQTYTPYVGVITIFVTRLLRGEAPVIFGDGEQQRDFVHVDDIVAGTHGGTGTTPGTYNLGTGRGTSLNAACRDADRASWRRTMQPAHARRAGRRAALLGR